MLKLHHWLKTKSMARFPPHLQPGYPATAGSARRSLGGQRCRRDGVWALEAYGAAYTPQKSDGQFGRCCRVGLPPRSIVKGERSKDPALHPSVLVKEQSWFMDSDGMDGVIRSARMKRRSSSQDGGAGYWMWVLVWAAVQSFLTLIFRHVIMAGCELFARGERSLPGFR